MSYTTLDQLNHYQGNSPWCYSVQRANSFSSDRPPSDYLEGSNQDCTNNGKGYETRAETDSCCAKESAGSWCVTPNYKAGTGYCHGDPSVACKWSPCGEDTCYSCKNFNCVEDSSSSQTLSACKAQCKAPAWVKPTTTPWCTCSSGEPHKLFKHYNIATDPNNSCDLSCTSSCSSNFGGPCSDPAYFPPPNPSANAATKGKSVWQCVIKDEESQTADAKITLSNSLTTGRPQRWYRFNDQPNDPNNSCETNCKKENLDPIASKYGIDLECKEVTDSYNPSCAEIWNWSGTYAPSRGTQNSFTPTRKVTQEDVGAAGTAAAYNSVCTQGLIRGKTYCSSRHCWSGAQCEQAWDFSRPGKNVDSPCLHATQWADTISCQRYANGVTAPKLWTGCAAYTLPEDLIANADSLR